MWIEVVRDGLTMDGIVARKPSIYVRFEKCAFDFELLS